MYGKDQSQYADFCSYVLSHVILVAETFLILRVHLIKG